MTWMGAAVRRAVGVAWRHRWTYAVPVATLLLPATLYAVRLPDMFRARAVVYVRPLESAHTGGALPEQRAAATHEMVQTSRDRLLTNANAAPVVPILYPGRSPQDPQALLGVKGRMLWDRAGDSSFAVSLEDTDPKRAADGVNAMLKAFQENERGVKLSREEGTLKSLEKERVAIQAENTAALSKIDAFRADHADTLPDQKEQLGAMAIQFHYLYRLLGGCQHII